MMGEGMYGYRKDNEKKEQTLQRTEVLRETLKGSFSGSSISTADCSLFVMAGPHAGQEISLDEEIIQIGRAPWCDLSLPQDRWISLRHCEMQLMEKGIRLRDCRSRNGIFVAGQQIFDACLVPGSRFTIGESEIEIRVQSPQRTIQVDFCDASGQLVGSSERMRQIFSLASRLAQRDVPLLITGETGTGKSTLAQAIHSQSPRKDGPFVVINCAALAPTLIESALFGHEKGAFTGAEERRLGCFAQAQGGSLLLDEIGELPLPLQPKLLDVLERRCFRPLGSEKEVQAEFRLFAATQRDLGRAVAEGTFREDLYYRLAIIEIEIPPLRTRPEDIPLLLEHFLQQQDPSRSLRLSTEALQQLQDYLWPGNVRQFRNTLERALTFLDGDLLDLSDLYLPSIYKLEGISSEERESCCGETPEPEEVSLEHLPAPLENQSAEEDGSSPHLAISFPRDLLRPTVQFATEAEEVSLELKRLLEEVERALVEKMLGLTGNVNAAAQRLGISRGWLYNRLKKYGLNFP